MKKIKKYVSQIDDELNSAEHYAEKYIEFKSDGDANMSAKFKEMASQELEHSMIIHDLAVKDIEKISAVFPAPADMREKWELSHTNFAERVARIKSMISF